MAVSQSISIQPRRAAVWMGIETTFGTAATTSRVHPIEGSIEMKLTQTEIENPELRTRVADYLAPVLGLKGGTFKLSFWLRPDATQIGATTTATRPYLGIPLLSALGGEFPTTGTTNAGVTVTSTTNGASATPLTLTATHGARLSKGAFFLPQVASGTEPAYVANIATDSITVVPALSAVSVAATGYGCYSYYFTEAAPPSVTIELALADDASQQWRLLGCMCTGLEIETTRDALIKLTFSYECASWEDGGQGGLTGGTIAVAAATNAMAAPMPMSAVQLMLQAAATLTAPSAFYSAPEFKVAFDLGNKWATELGGVQGKTGIQRTGGRPMVTASVTAYPQLDTATSPSTTVPASWWSGRTVLQAQLRAASGSGSSRRWCGLGIPSCLVVNKPAPTLGIDDDEKYQFELRGQLSTLTTSPSTDLAFSPVVCFLG